MRNIGNRQNATFFRKQKPMPPRNTQSCPWQPATKSVGRKKAQKAQK